jgi:hypothetical protein
MDQNNILSTLAIIISVISAIVSIINHKKITSSCCGIKREILSIDINDTNHTFQPSPLPRPSAS